MACGPILCLVWKLSRWFRVRGSVWEMRGLKFGMWVKSKFRIILEDTFWLNCSTWFWMYRRKASELHLPMSIMVYTGILSRYIAIAAPDRIECVPMSDILNPSVVSPIACAPAQRDCTTLLPDISNVDDLSWNTFTKDAVDREGMENTRWATRAQDLTGQRSLLFDACIVMVSNLWSFFWSLNVTDMTVADSNLDDDRGSSLPSR